MELVRASSLGRGEPALPVAKSAPLSLFHGGSAGRQPGDLILPRHAEHRYVPGCPDCEAHARGESGPLSGDPPTPPEWVYATSDRQYARYYASRAGLGWLYRVELLGEVEPSEEDAALAPAWRARSAQVVSVLERAVRLTMRERRRLFVRCGGSKQEWESLVASALVGRR